MQQVKRSRSNAAVPHVEFGDTAERRCHNRRIVWCCLRRGVGEIAEHGKVQMGLAVGEELHLKRFQRVTHIINAREQRRNHHGGAIRGRHAVLVQIESWQSLRWQERGQHLVQHGHGDIECWHERQQQQRGHRLARVRLDQQQHPQRRHEHQQREGTGEHRAWVSMHDALDLLADRRRIAGQLFELRHAVVDEPESDVGAHVGGLRPVGGGRSLRTIDRPLRHRRLAMAGCLGDAFHHMPVPIARGERHLRVEPRGIGAQHGFHHALLLDESAPVASPDIPQAGDAVGHHQSGQRQPVRRERDRCLRTDTRVSHPVLEPRERR